jgi:hypothetical protein
VHERVQQRIRICGAAVSSHTLAVAVVVASNVRVLVAVHMAVDSVLRQVDVRHRVMQFAGRPHGGQEHQARNQRRDERGVQGAARGAQAGREC